MRTRIFLPLADDSPVQIASVLYVQVEKMMVSYSVSEQTSRATASLLSGSPGGGAGSLSASKSFSERREALFHPRDYALLGNCQAIVLPYDGQRAHATRGAAISSRTPSRGSARTGAPGRRESCRWS